MNKETHNTLVPVLRFPEFQDEEGWEEKTLGEVAIFLKGKGISKSDVVQNGKLPCIRYGELYTHYNETIDKVISFTNISSNELVLSQANDVIIPASGETKEDIATASCVIKSNIALGGDLNIIRSNINGIFLSYYLNNPKKKDIAKLAQGISVVHLYSSQLKTLDINIPKLSEQQKIADCLSSLDELIQTESQVLEALKTHKKGLMQQLFPAEGETVPQLRFPEFMDDEEWEEKSLGEIGKFTGGGTPDTKNSEYWEGDIEWFTPTEVKEKYLSISNRKITEKGLKNSSAKLLPVGTLLITTRATIGDVGIATTSCTTNQGFQSLIVNENQVNIFWYYWLIFNKKELIKRASGSTFPEIGKNEIVQIAGFVPSKSEQQRIADCLSSLDEQIALKSQQIEALKVHKKGLMQQLFPTIDD